MATRTKKKTPVVRKESAAPDNYAATHPVSEDDQDKVKPSKGMVEIRSRAHGTRILSSADLRVLGAEPSDNEDLIWHGIQSTVFVSKAIADLLVQTGEFTIE